MYGKGLVDIMTKRTKTELGIDHNTLGAGSHVKIYVRCRRCGEEFLREYRNLHQRHNCPTHITRSDGTKMKWCNGCSMFLTYKSFTTNNARYDGLSSLCKTCSNARPSAQRHNNTRAIERHTPEGWMKWALSQKKAECRKNGMDFDIDIDYLRDIYERQGGLCIYAKVKLEFGTTSLRSASLERLDSEIGYVRGNVVLASKAMNWAKNNASEADFLVFILDMLAGVSKYVRLEAKVTNPNGKLPFRKRTSDAGYDVASIERVTIAPHSVANVDTGIIISPPDGMYYSIEGRSSLWLKGIMPLRGIVDGTYQGELMVAIANNSDHSYTIEPGDRIAQLVLHEVVHADIVEVAEFSKHDGGRAVDGFGSSGR